jgi:5-methylcytosine-specific restriction endonuclease McrA
MALKHCLSCGRLSRGSYCHRCGDGRLRGRKGQQLRKAILGAFSYQCAQCGAFNVPLQVHHVDGDRRNNSVANLRPLCRDCHKEAGSQLF